jgi:hypothetical protein
VSLKALKTLIEQCADGMEGDEPDRILDARSEVAAIERAAMVISENVKIPAIPAELEPALSLMESIAKEAE